MGLKKFLKSLFKSSNSKKTVSTSVVTSPVKKEQFKSKLSNTITTTEEAPAKAEYTVEELQDITEISEIKYEENVQTIPEEAVPGTSEAIAAITEANVQDLESYDFEEVHTQEAEEIEKTYKDVSDEASTRIGRDDPFVFGQRKLENEDDVWNHNAWDNVELTEEQIKELEVKIEVQKEHPVKDFDKKLVNENPAKYWDLFYKNNRENFFKDRKWLQIEFPSLYEATKADAGEKLIFEIGCGAGNSMFPILSQNENPKLRIHGSDFSPRAVELVKNSENFDEKITSASVWDLSNAEGILPEGIEENSVDIALMVFVFSALSPNEWDNALNNLSKILKPGGKILFRDYGRYDLAQVRFKKNRFLEDNFYIRGDNTRVYFFTEEELREIFTKKFIENRIGMDRRLIVNRKRQVKMYRCWLQAVFDVPTLEQEQEETDIVTSTETEKVEESNTEEVTPVVVTEEQESASDVKVSAVIEKEEEKEMKEDVVEGQVVTEEENEASVAVKEEVPTVKVVTEEEVETVAVEAPIEAVEETTTAAEETVVVVDTEPVTEESVANPGSEEEEKEEEIPAVPVSSGSTKTSNNKKKNNKKKKKKGKK